MDESIDALAYSVAWHTLSSSITHFSEDVGQEAAREAIPRLVASRGANFEDTLRFCRSLLGGLYDMTTAAIRTRYDAAAAAAAAIDEAPQGPLENWRVERSALKILVESSLDVASMLSSRRDSVAALGGGPSSAASSPMHPPTPSKVALSAVASSSPRKPPVAPPTNLSASMSSKHPLEESIIAAPPPTTTAATSMSRLCTPHTLINLLMCAYLDSMVSMVFTDVLGDANTEEGRGRAKLFVRQDDDGSDVDREELDASNAFFSFSMIVGTDPDDVLYKFLEYLRAAPYSLRLVWEKTPFEAKRSEVLQLASSPISPSSAATTMSPSFPQPSPQLVNTTWSSSSRRLMILRSVAGTMLETAGPSTPEANAVVARLWRYVA